MSEFFDDNGLLGPHGENDIIFTIEYYVLKKILKEEIIISNLTSAIETLRNGECSFQSKDTSEPWSHDNHTALISASVIFGLDYHKTFFWSGWWRRAHPRDVIFYLHSLGGIWKLIILPFIPLFSIILVYTFFPRYKNIDGAQILATDGKLLSFLRLETGNYPLTKKICYAMIKHYHGSWIKIFETYFKDPSHPNNVLAREVFNEKIDRSS